MVRDVLVVDDERSVCEALKTFFEVKGLHVRTASTAEEALHCLRERPTEVVLLDVKLPDRSGLDLLPELKSHHPALRIVIISALDDADVIKTALARGAERFLTKPLEAAHCFYAAMGVRTVDVDQVQADPEALACLPRDLAQQSQALPMRLTTQGLEVAMLDPLDASARRRLKEQTRYPIVPWAIIGGDLETAITRSYRACANRAAADPSVDALVKAWLHEAFTRGVTELYLGFGRDRWRCCEHLHGEFVEGSLPPSLHARGEALIASLKRLAHLDTGPSAQLRTARLRCSLGSDRMTAQVSVLPTVQGEEIAIRFTAPATPPPLEALGLSSAQHAFVERWLRRTSGLMLVVEPERSGIATTLYACLARLARRGITIATVEESVEHLLEGITQLEVDPEHGLTMAEGVHAGLGYGAEALMVGHARDRDTAELIIKAVLTGRLVLAGVLADDAASGIARFLELGVDHFVLGSVLVGVVAQRRLNALCPRCRRPSEVPGGAVAPMMGLRDRRPSAAGTLKLWHARGCAACQGRGIKGEVTIFEVLPVTRHIQSLLLKRASSAQLRQSAMATGMQSLWQAGWQLVREGTVSLEELARVVPSHLR